MTRLATFGLMLALSVASTACAANKSSEGVIGADLGVIPIGSVPKDMHTFVVSDCGGQEPPYADCSAEDAEGRRYVFFNGALSKVVAARVDAKKSLRLPASLEFGEDIERSAKKAALAFGVKLTRAYSYNGLEVYSSDFVVKSSVGILYSIELVADKKGRLAEVVERTDF